MSAGVNHPPMGEHEMALGPIHICSRWAAWSSWSSSNNWSCCLSVSGDHAPTCTTFSGLSVIICAQPLSDLMGRGLVLVNWGSAGWGWPTDVEWAEGLHKGILGEVEGLILGNKMSSLFLKKNVGWAYHDEEAIKSIFHQLLYQLLLLDFCNEIL